MSDDSIEDNVWNGLTSVSVEIDADDVVDAVVKTLPAEVAETPDVT